MTGGLGRWVLPTKQEWLRRPRLRFQLIWFELLGLSWNVDAQAFRTSSRALVKIVKSTWGVYEILILIDYLPSWQSFLSWQSRNTHIPWHASQKRWEFSIFKNIRRLGAKHSLKWTTHLIVMFIYILKSLLVQREISISSFHSASVSRDLRCFDITFIDC